jgi:hypothetical protein
LKCIHKIIFCYLIIGFQRYLSLNFTYRNNPLKFILCGAFIQFLYVICVYHNFWSFLLLSLLLVHHHVMSMLFSDVIDVLYSSYLGTYAPCNTFQISCLCILSCAFSISIKAKCVSAKFPSVLSNCRNYINFRYL